MALSAHRWAGWVPQSGRDLTGDGAFHVGCAVAGPPRHRAGGGIEGLGGDESS